MSLAAQPVTDAFTAEILRSYLVSTVREMVITTTRTAYSTCFCHGEDFTCGLFDAAGRMIAQDQGVGVHAGGLDGAIRAVLNASSSFSAGDVFLHNDPYDGGTHQGDVCAVRPIFAAGEHVGFAANRGHWSDVGGMAPGGWSGAAQDVVQEGLILPAVCLYRAGTLQRDIQQLILRNVRLARQCWGDLQAQIASNIAAERRIAALVERQGISGLQAASDAAIEYSRRRFLAALEAMPDGEAEGVDVIEDDGRGGGPFAIHVRLRKHPGGIEADFTGSADQVSAPVNCTLACLRAAVIGSVVACVDTDVPLNAGLTELFVVRAPLGSIVNPTYPAPTFGTTADPAARAAETVLRAIGQLAPERVPAGSYSTGQNVTGGGRMDGGDEEFLWYSYQAGGCGAWDGGDGNSAEWHLMANSKNESMEVWESRYPVEHLGMTFVTDSGGPGRWRGGLAIERRWRVLADTRLSAIADHHGIGAHGLFGGLPGLPNGFAVERDGVRLSVQELFALESPSKFANLQLRRGDVFVSIQGGGGGYGSPALRDPEALEADVRGGVVSAEAAERWYGRSNR